MILLLLEAAVTPAPALDWTAVSIFIVGGIAGLVGIAFTFSSATNTRLAVFRTEMESRKELDKQSLDHLHARVHTLEEERKSDALAASQLEKELKKEMGEVREQLASISGKLDQLLANRACS